MFIHFTRRPGFITGRPALNITARGVYNFTIKVDTCHLCDTTFQGKYVPKVMHSFTTPNLLHEFRFNLHRKLEKEQAAELITRLVRYVNCVDEAYKIIFFW